MSTNTVHIHSAGPQRLTYSHANNRKAMTSLEPDAPRDKVVSSEITEVPFDGFLKFKNYQVEISTGEILTRYNGGFVHGPGHHISAVAALAFDESMKPHPILKTGDTRLARAERNEPYVKDGFIAGRMDKRDADKTKIALAELAEEVGGEVVPGTFKPLGEMTPTMPFESTECDQYFIAAVHISGTPVGDGGEMELTDLIGPKVVTANEAIEAMDGGELSESSRTRSMYGRSFDAMGFIPQLDAYVHDHPELKERFQTLGLGEVTDIRRGLTPSVLPESKPPSNSLESRVNDVTCTQREAVELSEDSRMVNAKTRHVVNENDLYVELDKEFPNQYLQLDYDRAKVANYYVDSERGPMIQMSAQARPALAFAPDSPQVVRQDVSDLKLSRDREIGEQLPSGTRLLGNPSGASAGQSDLNYYFGVNQVEPPAQPEAHGYVPLAEAIRLCRTGEGDAHTEALCERLADDLDWLPNLGMSVDQARSLMAL